MDIKMDITKITNNLSKLNMYKGIEIDNFISINVKLRKLSSCYSSNNKNNLNDKKDSIVKKFELVKKMHNNNTYVVNKNISVYVDTAKSVTNKFKGIR